MSDGTDGDGHGGDGGNGDDGRDADGPPGGGADTRRVPVGVVDAFAAEPLAGAPVGVVPDATGIAAGVRRALTAELGGAGTAFVGPPEDADADRRLWYLSSGAAHGPPGPPTGGIESGDDDNRPPVRATVAAVSRLLADGRVDPGPLAVGTATGVVEAEATPDGVVWVAAGDPDVDTVSLDYDRVGEALGVTPAALRDVGADLPAAVASVGRPFLVVPVNFLERLSGADPDREALAALADEYGVAGVYPVTFDAVTADATLHARSFPATPGAPEDPVTGRAAGAAGAYLHAVEAFDGDPPDELRIEQGHFVDRPGLVRVRVTDDGVRIGGRGVAALDGRAALPDDGDGDGDDILVA